MKQGNKKRNTKKKEIRFHFIIITMIVFFTFYKNYDYQNSKKKKKIYK